jgi:hypothetical protein
MRAKQYCQKAKHDKVLEDKIQAAVKNVKDETVPSAAAAASWNHSLELQYTTIWHHVNDKTTLLDYECTAGIGMVVPESGTTLVTYTTVRLCYR